MVLPATLLDVLPASAAPEDLTPIAAQKEKSVPVRALTGEALAPTEVSKRATVAPGPATWPTAGTVEIDLVPTPKRAGAMPVRVGGAGKARIEVLDRAAAERAKVRGVIVRLDRPNGHRGKIALEVDYAAYRDAFGGDWSHRLRLLALPECALTTPDLPQCQGKPVAARNDVGTGKVVTDVETDSARMFALTAAGSGPTGNFGATTLSPSATWSSGGSSGDFSWSYPFKLPPVGGELVPQVGLSYSSQSVDGRTATTNNQPSAIGEGFDFQPGHIERRYKACADDLGGNNGQTKTGDLCWATDNATMTLSGRGGELVPTDATGTNWRLRNDDGTRVQRLTGAANGDDNGETWLVTSPEGTKYHFGSRSAAQSTLTVPVFGNNAGEPCTKPAFADSSCTQAYRWNLDYVVDPHKNAMSYQYAAETNFYARNQNTVAGTQYTRASQLSRIDYGLRDGGTGAALARVVFETADRCLPGTTCGPTQPQNSPDIPWDQHCAAGACQNQSPSFWTQKRLSKVVAQVWDGANHTQVDSWTLRQSYPANGDTTRAGLWLDGITHTGHVGGTQSMPEVTFEGVQLANRVNEANGPLMNWWRIRSIRSEYGGTLTIGYADKDCSATVLPASPDSNTKRCQPSLREENGQQKLEYFHKYVVTSVVQNANIAGDQSTPVETHYEYVGAPAWHYDDEDGLVPPEKKTWSQWRGYEFVRVRNGSAIEGKQSYAQTQYFRGMDGDKLAAGGAKSVKVTDSENVAVADQDALAGSVRETISYGAVANPPVAVAGTITDPWVSAPTATAVRPWGTTHARHSGAAATRSWATKADGSVRRVRTESSFDADGVVTQVDELGDLSTPDDDRCTRYRHVRNLDAGLAALPSEVETVTVSCDKTPVRPGDVLSLSEMFYDDATTHDVPPTKGTVTLTKELAGWSGDTPIMATASRTEFDALGRPIRSWDKKNEPTTTEYLTTAAGQVGSVRVVDPAGHTTVAELDQRGAVAAEVDANGKRSELENDPLGRTRKVWAPGRKKGVDSPNGEFLYDLRAGTPSVLTTKRLQHDGAYLSTHELFDGLTRLRQTQMPAPGGGRTIADLVYNSRGQVVKRNSGYWNSAPAGTELVVADDATVPAQTRTTYDALGRTTVEAFHKLGVKQWETSTVEDIDRVTVDPPDGGTATTTLRDAGAKPTVLRQHLGGAPTGAADETKYGYDKADRLTSVTDPAGNVWRYHYDVRGRKYKIEDPDRGVTTLEYNEADEVVSSTDDQGRKLFFGYDKLGRKTEVRQDSPTGPLRQSWVYDTVAKGQLTSATRHVGEAGYVSAITGYDDNYQPTGTKVTIPAAEGKLAGDYVTTAAYTPNGLLKSLSVPAAGGLPAEKLDTTYDAFSQPLTLSAMAADNTVAFRYVRDTKYTPYGETSQFSLGNLGKSVWLTQMYEEGTRRLARSVSDREASGKTQGDLTYGYDHAGNVTRIADQPSSFTGVPSDYQCFKSDHLRRTTNAWTPADGNCAPAPTAAGLGGPAKFWSSFGYDATGNRTAETTYTVAGKTERTYAYPAPGQPRPHGLTSVTTKNPDNSVRTDEYGYDTTGNTTTRKLNGSVQQLSWDAEGKLTGVVQGGDTTSYVYDANGSRLLRRDPTGTTLYVAGMELRLHKANDTTIGTRYYSHAGQVVGMRTGAGTVYWISSDHHGTASLLFNSVTLDVTRRRFQPFGQERGAPVAWPDEHGFLGKTKDPSTGLTNVGAREYDVTTGRFLSVDPIIDHGDPQQMNGYAYSNNNRATFTDPSGLRATCELADGTVTTRGCDTNLPAPTGGTNSEPPPDIQKAKDDLSRLQGERAKHEAAAKRNALIDTLKEVGLDLLLDLIGVTDFRDCFTKGDVGACLGVVSNFIPWAKVFKIGSKLVKGLTRAFKVFRAIQDGIRHAVQALRRIDEQIKELNDKIASWVSGGGGGCNSFVPGTSVLMADGTHRPIEEVRAGDQVVATDPETGETSAETVTTAITGHGDKQLVEITVDTGDGSDKIVATEGHPFWVAGERAWLDAKDLRPGHLLRTSAGIYVQVTLVQPRKAHQRVHNLTVSDLHTFYVTVGALDTDVLTHNTNPKSGPAQCPISMDEAVRRGTEHVGGQGEMGVSGSGGWQFIRTEVDGNGNKVTRITRFDIDLSSSHVQKEGPHLNTETQINGKRVKTGPLADPHTPIDMSTVRPGDIP